MDISKLSKVEASPDTKWLLLKTADPNYGKLIAECERMHKKYRRNSELSILLSNDKSLALVKVYGTETDWIIKNEINDTITKSPVIDTVYSVDTHKEVLKLIQTKPWVRTDE